MMTWMENPKHLFKAALFIWTYDLLRFLILFRSLNLYDINPWIFFLLDMSTVPGYVKGWSRLIGSLSRERQNIRRIIQWSLITFFCSTAPYLYSAWAGRQAFPMFAWIILCLVAAFPLISITKRICTE